MNQIILIVDDIPDNIHLLKEVLSPLYTIRSATTGLKALEYAQIDPKPDLILLDVMMPNMSGFEVCFRLKNDPATEHIPVIFVTANGEMEDESKGFDAGAVDYITKPISPPIVLRRVKTHLRLIWKELAVIEALLALMRAAALKDNETANHTLRVGVIAHLISIRLGKDVLFSRRLFLVAPLHDIGKIGVPDQILHFPGNLREYPDGWAKIQQHPVYGADIIGNHGIHSPIMHMAYNVARFHHEKEDGSGYPDGLKGEKIPFEAMIASIADMIDAMLDPTRPYRSGAMPEEVIKDLIIKDRGIKLRADIVDAAMALWPEIMAVQRAFPNETPVPFEEFSHLSPELLETRIRAILDANM